MDFDLCYYIAPVALALGVLIGRFTHKRTGLKEYNSILSSLNESSQEAAKRKLKYSIYCSRLQLFSRFLLAAYIITGFLLIYHHDVNILLDNYIYSISALLILISFYASTFGTYWVVQDSEKKIELYKQKIISSKSQLIKDLGQEVIEAIKENDTCNAKCKEKTAKLEKDLNKHIQFIKDLAGFQWCDGCAQQVACTGGCGGKFFAFTKRKLMDLKL
ncbi:unnamed protein product [Blepharisma stoltei]|uniref:Uncharacterized protein n=1 Tax=Blepharisma stoltei TaxID=1481888 RepID=A0AAU9JP15_9CILI|nr:unnamed protein product [Blepharisma stoltei]